MLKLTAYPSASNFCRIVAMPRDLVDEKKKAANGIKKT